MSFERADAAACVAVVAWIAAFPDSMPTRTTKADHAASGPVAEVPSAAILSAIEPSRPPAPGVPAAMPEASVGIIVRPSAAGVPAANEKKFRPVVPAEVAPVE